MRKILILLLSFLSTVSFAKKNTVEIAKAITAEGKMLYKSEMASWFGTDIFMEVYENKENIGGYFSYIENDSARCIFVSKDEHPKVIGTITFDSTYNLKKADVNLKERALTSTEKDLFELRKLAMSAIVSDTLFKYYENTSFNIIPIINKKEKKVYILTGPKINGTVIFGNDYLITFNKDNKIVQKKALHKNIIPLEYETVGESEATMHNHLPETGDYITPTDICTLMLYEKMAGWKTHYVISKKYWSFWNCETNSLAIISAKVMDKVYKDQKKRNAEKELKLLISK